LQYGHKTSEARTFLLYILEQLLEEESVTEAIERLVGLYVLGNSGEAEMSQARNAAIGREARGGVSGKRGVQRRKVVLFEVCGCRRGNNTIYARNWTETEGRGNTNAPLARYGLMR
jgi:hypothetical protein